MEDKERNRDLKKPSHPDEEPKWYKWSMTVSLIVMGLGALLLIWSARDTSEPNDGLEDETEEVSSGAPRDIAYENIDTSLEERPFTISRADKDIQSLDNVSPKVAPEDDSGNWFLTMQDSGEAFVDYSLSYAETYIGEASDEVHWVIDTTNQRTTSIENKGDYLHVWVYEHLEGEEQHVATLGTGVPITDYHVYKDNGDIVDPHGREIEDDDGGE